MAKFSKDAGPQRTDTNQGKSRNPKRGSGSLPQGQSSPRKAGVDRQIGAQEI
jgi:hypothetical protein